MNIFRSLPNRVWAFGWWQSEKKKIATQIFQDFSRFRLRRRFALKMSEFELEERRSEACSRVLSASVGSPLEDWEYKKDKKTYDILYRAHGLIAYPIEEVLEVASRVESRPEWDPMCSGGRCIAFTDDEPSIVWWSFYGIPLLVSARDFCMCLRVQHVDDGTGRVVIGTQSIESDECPPDSRYTRGHANIAGLVLRPVARDSPNSVFLEDEVPRHSPEELDNLRVSGITSVTYVACVDPRGWIPSMLVNVGAERGVMCIEHLREYLNRVHQE